jgi:hypothetical protein
MSKKKVCLSGRPRTRELQQKNQLNTECVATKKKAEILGLQEADVLTLIPDVVEVKMSYTQEIIFKLRDKYELWSQPINRNRYRYSPNRRNQMLLSEIGVLLNDVAHKLLEEGYPESDCKYQCQIFLDELTSGLRSEGIPIGNIHINPQRRNY